MGWHHRTCSLVTFDRLYRWTQSGANHFSSLFLTCITLANALVNDMPRTTLLAQDDASQQLPPLAQQHGAGDDDSWLFVLRDLYFRCPWSRGFGSQSDMEPYVVSGGLAQIAGVCGGAIAARTNTHTGGLLHTGSVDNMSKIYKVPAVHVSGCCCTCCMAHGLKSTVECVPLTHR